MAVSRDEQAHDLAIHHRIALGRYSTSVVHKVIATLNRIEKDALARLALADNEGLAQVRLEQLLQEIRAIQSSGWFIIRQRMGTAVQELTDAELTFAEKLVKVIAPDVFSAAPSLPQVLAAVQARPFQGRLLREFLAGAEEAAAAKVRETIRQGFIEGVPTAQIVRNLRGTAANQYKDGVLEGTRRGVEAMVRTAITHTANVAQQSVYEQNADIIRKWRFVATLDSRTTLLCASLHGKEYDLGKGPQPPRHIGCRSTSVPVVAPIPGVKPFEPPSYEGWLRKQSAETQDDILGATKGKLFRSGGLSVDRFVDRAGKTLTIEQLRQRDASAFERAGLD